jgi:hypothetical protein
MPDEKQTIRISVYEAIGNSAAISTEDGEMIFNRVKDLLSNDKKIIVDFTNIDLVVSTFLNASVGQLYGFYSPDVIRDNFNVEGLSDEDLNLLKKVIETAKQYFENRSGFENTVKESFDDE